MKLARACVFQGGARKSQPRPRALADAWHLSLGSGAAPVWYNPRRRSEAAINPRAERGRHPTETSKVVPNPRIAARSTVAYYWRRLFRWTLSPPGQQNEDNLT